MNILESSEDANVFAAPSSLHLRKYKSSPISHSATIPHNSGQVRHQPRLKSRKAAIMRLHNMDLENNNSDDHQIQKSENIFSENNPMPLFDDSTCELLFTPPRGSSTVPGSTPGPVGLDIDMTSVASSPSPPRPAATTPPRLKRKSTRITPFASKQTNVSHLFIGHVLDRPLASESSMSTTGPFRLQMKRSSTTCTSTDEQ
mmetsp:Transcript_20665/g.59223  ORF Transcript_20665/g.59223 Transcript_20665/m.59223 type:complete len:201 (-) Transcript_20665:279-881(-)|eukprot:CAMPEP_0181043564 /NCGR_PEP_ID=MMETSP1070-20121207/12782_1 /TAXON_ID=265543 /ORGANISM="Minutocellus polymorphus, Strain NH13" /LENGTH=200 /DNA_ID=CAMNT_0023121915 /DNA_START=227 /DNA_END=829 /DNA_ORIENTATION=+